MTQNQLEYFLELTRTLNFTKAAERFFISQTAISKQIQSLEEELGVKLFLRTSRSVELTSAGRAFAEDVPGILNNMYDAVSRLHKVSLEFSGHLSIGFVKGSESTGFHENLFRFHKKYPNVSISLSRMNDFDLYLALDSFDVDLAFCLPYQSRSDVYARLPYRTYPLVCITYPSHPFAEREAVSLEELSEEPLLLLPSAADLPKSSGMRISALSYFPDGFEPKYVTWCGDVESILLMVSLQMGVSLMPAFTSTALSDSRLLYTVPVAGGESLVRLQAVSRKDNGNPALKRLLPYFEYGPVVPARGPI